MKKRTKYAQPGDQVKVITPKLFIRCGYPLDQRILLRERELEVSSLARKAWRAMNIDQKTFQSYVPDHVNRLLINAACSFILNKEKWGGNERKIYEEDVPELEGKIVEVLRKRFVKTGIYIPGYMSGYEEPDWTPPMLEGEKTHCVYEIEAWQYLYRSNHAFLRTEILAEHCDRDNFRIEQVLEKFDAGAKEQV